jgi:hypothetical protein
MATDVSICSSALTLLGEGVITSFTDGNKGPIAAVLYTDAKNTALSAHPWKFTIKQKQLTRLVAAPTVRFDYKYTLPTDGIGNGVIALYQTVGSVNSDLKEYVIQGGEVLTNADIVYAEYQADVHESDWPPHFITFMKHVMATEMAFPVTRKLDVQKYWYDRTYGTPQDNGAGGLFAKTRNTDSKSGPANNRISGFPLIQTRYNGVR